MFIPITDTESISVVDQHSVYCKILDIQNNIHKRFDVWPFRPVPVWCLHLEPYNHRKQGTNMQMKIVFHALEYFLNENLLFHNMRLS